MMEELLKIDTALMHWINEGWSNPVFDFILPLIRNKYFWIPLYVLCLSWIMYNYRIRYIMMIFLFLGLSIFAADTISSQLIKKQIQRPRPCHLQELDPPVILRVECGIGYSFTSSHAANHFCLAAFFISIFGVVMDKWKHLWWLWAGLISLAQVYVGLHYPLDILGGAILGIIVGSSMGRFCFHRLVAMAHQDNLSNTNL